MEFASNHFSDEFDRSSGRRCARFMEMPPVGRDVN